MGFHGQRVAKLGWLPSGQSAETSKQVIPYPFQIDG